jgi:hypothetical protein
VLPPSNGVTSSSAVAAATPPRLVDPVHSQKAGQHMQLPASGGNLVTKSPFRLDPVTGRWCLNAFIEAPEVRALNLGPAHPRRWPLSLLTRVRVR